MVNLNGLSPEEKEIATRFQELTDKATELRQETIKNAADRRECAKQLQSRGWSLRKIGDVIGVSGQRIDSMVKMRAAGE